MLTNSTSEEATRTSKTLRIRNTATQTAVIACAPEGAGSSLKIRGSGGTTYNVVLIDPVPASPYKSNARVQTSSGTKALRCLYSGCGES